MGLGDNGDNDFESDLTRSLDEAFAKGPPPRTKSRDRSTTRRARSPQGEKSVESHGSGAGGPGRGIQRQRSQRKAKIAAAVSLMASAGDSRSDGMEEQVSAAREKTKRVPRRSKTHEDRLMAAAQMGVLTGQGANNLGYEDEFQNDHSGGDRHERGHHRHASGGRGHRQQEVYDDDDDAYYDEEESEEEEEYEEARPTREERRERPRGGGRRAERRRSNDNDAEYEQDHGQPRGGRRPRRGGGGRDQDSEYEGDARDAARRSRYTARGPVKSFDDTIGGRASRRRRSMMGGGASVASEATEDTHQSTLRARRSARRASAMGDAGGARAEPAARGVRETYSGGRARRATMSTSSEMNDSGYGYADPDQDYEDYNGMDNSQEDAIIDPDRERRANRQKDIMERLRRAKEAKEESDEGSLDEEEIQEPEPEPEPEPKGKKGRRVSLGMKFGMSSSNFATVEGDDASHHRGKEKPAKPGRTGKTPARAKSTDGAVGGGSRARAADRDRRRPGTMLDRIGG